MSPRYIYRLIIAFLKRFKGIIAIGVIAGILFFLFLNLLLPNIDFVKQKIGMVGRFTPDAIPSDISSKLSQGLTTVDKNGNVNPALAKSWESPDSGKTWIFHLNDSINWQDGKKVVATDINYEFSDAAVSVIDTKTIKFSLNSPFSAFPIIVSKPIFKKGLVGTGEWKVKKISISGGYIQKLVIDSEKSEMTYKFYPTEERLKLAFELGEIDSLSMIQDPTPFDRWKTVNIEKEIGYDNFVGIFLNTADEKLADKQVRQNLDYAIDKDIFNDKNNVFGERSIGPISPNSWAYNSQVKQYSKDIEKAKDLKGMKINLSTLPNLLPVAEKIKANWEAVGVVCEIQVVTDVPTDFQAFLATVDIPKDPDQYSLWHSTQTETNISNFKNARIDKLLEDGRTELDQETRKKIYLDFQRFLVEDVPAIFLYHPTFYTIDRK